LAQPTTPTNLHTSFIHSIPTNLYIIKKGKRKLKTVLARVPDLPKGDYTLRIVTKFSNASTSLKEARTIEYARLLTVK
jgi:hypothetical protein